MPNDLGAHKFIYTKDEEQVKTVQGYFDFILDTVSADHDYNFYIGMLKTKGAMVCVGLPPTPAQIPAFSMIFFGRNFAGSLIGGISRNTGNAGLLCRQQYYLRCGNDQHC